MNNCMHDTSTSHDSQLVLTYAALLSACGLLLLVVLAARTPLITPQQPHVAAVSAAVPTPTHAFDDVRIVGDAAYVYDVYNDRPHYAQNEHAQLPLASLTKIMLALIVAEELDLNSVIRITADDLTPEGESGFVAGERWRVRELLDFTLMTSSNDGATALARVVERETGRDIATLMNARARELGLAQTYFLNETGLDNSVLSSGAYGSAADIGALFSYAYTHVPEVLAATAHEAHTFSNFDGKAYEATNTNVALHELPGIVFGKTGFTDLAGGNLAVVIEPEPQHALVVVVLGSTIDQRFTDVLTLARTARSPAH